MLTELTQKAVMRSWELFPHAVSIVFMKSTLYCIWFNFLSIYLQLFMFYARRGMIDNGTASDLLGLVAVLTRSRDMLGRKLSGTTTEFRPTCMWLPMSSRKAPPLWLASTKLYFLVTTLSLFNLLAVPAPRLLSLFLAR